MKTINKSRWKYLPKLFKDMGFTKGAEIGVEKGAFSKYLCQDNPALKLYSIDSWKAYKFIDTKYGKSQTRQNNYYEHAKAKLAPYNCEIIKGFSMDVVKKFKDGELDFVYIDANHDYNFVKKDIQAWSKKVRKGGIVSGHDYFVFPSGNNGVVRAVNEWVTENKIELTVLNKDEMPSWYYTKE